MPDTELPPVIYHLALDAEWRDAVAGGVDYQRSTVGRSLAEQGFIHCSFAGQVRATADRFYRGRQDVLLLTIDSSALPSPVRVENLEGGDELYPHLYGSLPVAAVIRVAAVPCLADGCLDFGPLPDQG